MASDEIRVDVLSIPGSSFYRNKLVTMQLLRVRMRSLLWSIAFFPALVDAQSSQLITSARTAGASATTAGRTTSATATTLQNARVLPLFGEQSKTAEQIGQEIQFLNSCDQNFASRPEASQFFAARGWEYIAESQLDTAAYRFNLAWLLNPKNADAYWGLGVVCYQQNKLPDAVRMLKKGLVVADTNAVLMTDLATVQIKQYELTRDTTDLREAETLLHRSVALLPANATAMMKLSLVNYVRADYKQAWEYFHKARTIDISALDLVYLNDLMAKLPDPQGLFK